MNTLHLALFFFFFIGSCQSTIYWRAAYVSDAPIHVAEQFVARLFEAAKKNDVSTLDNLVSETFHYQGCQADFTKVDLIAILSSPDTAGMFSVTVKRGTFTPDANRLNFIVAVKDSDNEPEFEVSFNLGKRDNVVGSWLLLDGIHGACSRKFHFGTFQ